jgi:hypothetical protein
MADGTAYGLSDLLLFSPRVYYRLFELHHQELWPVSALTTALGLIVLWLLLRPSRLAHRLVPAILGALWLWVAWAYFWERYATINWVAGYLAPVFALQGVLLLGVAGASGGLSLQPRRTIPDLAELTLFVLAIAGYPWIAPAMGRSWQAAETFGMAPDPTAVATLAVLATVNGRARWILLPIPVLWCALSGTTLWVMGAGDFLVAPLGAFLTTAIALRTVHRPATTGRPS